jgi:predicted enzyme related to lactoylglutathione lyase
MSNCSASIPRQRGVACTLLVLATLAQYAQAQSPQTPPLMDGQTVVRGIYNWVHTTGDAERAFPFYHDVFGIELASSPFAGNANAPPEQIRSVSEAGSDSLVWDLTNTHGSRFRTVFMRTANTPFGLELSEFFDIPRDTRAANAWDPGASILIFEVRDLNAVVSKVEARGAASFVTLGGMPVDTPAGRSILLRDPDGYLLRAIQASPAAIARAASADEVVSTSIGVAVADTSVALEFYRGLLGFDVRETRGATEAELQLHGLADGSLIQTTTLIPGTGVAVVFLEFDPGPAATQPANSFHWKIQDVGAPQFQLQVSGLDALLERTKQAGYRLLSVDAMPIQRSFGRFVFAIDPDGVLVEFVEPAPQR